MTRYFFLLQLVW